MNQNLIDAANQQAIEIIQSSVIELVTVDVAKNRLPFLKEGAASASATHTPIDLVVLFRAACSAALCSAECEPLNHLEIRSCTDLEMI